MNKTDLTPRERDVLRAISAFIAKHHYPPSQSEIAEAVGVSSKHGVRIHLTSLEAKGRITRDAGVARGIRILKQS